MDFITAFFKIIKILITIVINILIYYNNYYYNKKSGIKDYIRLMIGFSPEKIL